MREEDKRRVELIQVAVKEIMNEKSNQKGKDELYDDEHELLSALLIQLDALEKKHRITDIVDKDKSNKNEATSTSTTEIKDCLEEMRIDEVLKEIRKLKRQNTITHCLLSVLIVVTAFWQFSEVSMLLAVKEKLANPIKAISEMVKSVFKGQESHIELPSMAPVGVPQLPHVDLPVLTSNSDED